MMRRIAEWFHHRWVGTDPTLLESYRATFSSLQGQQVIQHLLDSVYCTVYEGRDPNEALIHNARRTVVHEILVNLDLAENPKKYHVQVVQEQSNALV